MTKISDHAKVYCVKNARKHGVSLTRTMGSKWNGIPRNKKPRKISRKRAKKIQGDKSYYMGLKRTKKPRMVSVKQAIKMKQDSKVKQEIRQRANGHCEICGEKPCPPTFALSVHELIFRSAGKTAGGVVSENNSFGVCDLCHYIFQHFIYRFKGQCQRVLMQGRNISYEQSLILYKKIIEFCKEHNLLKDKL